MNCRQVKRAISGYQIEPIINGEVEAHARLCRKCSQELAIEKMTRELVRSDSLDTYELSYWDEVRLVNRIKLRIQEMEKRNLSSWENSVIAIRGWLLAFGVLAILLLLMSGHMAISNSYEMQGQLQEARTEAGLGEEIISSNSTSSWPVGEESGNGN